MAEKVRKIGILGYGNLGEYLSKQICGDKDSNLELKFIWNRDINKLENEFDERLILRDLDDFRLHQVDLIVEVSHPDVSRNYAAEIINHCDYMIGSPSCLADEKLEKSLISKSVKYGVFVPSGALWGASDLRSLSDRNILTELEIEMTFHPDSLRLQEPLKTSNEQAKSMNDSVTLYRGPVRDVCKLAPNNVNTMACAAIAARNLGFDKTIGTLISNPRNNDEHKIVIKAFGKKTAANKQFKIITERISPAEPGKVTSSVTYSSFYNSLLKAKHAGPGFHLC